MSYSTILFDLDGTLTDPMVGITKSFQYALAKFDIKIEDYTTLAYVIGPPLLESFKDSFDFTESDSKQAVLYFREYFSTKGMYENVVYAGVEVMLKKLVDRNIHLILATSKSTYFSKKIMEHFSLDQYFDHIVGSNLDGTKSDKTEIIKDIIDTYHIDIKETVMVGDRKHDLIGANNCEIDCIGVSYGFGGRQELEKENPKLIVDSVEELSLELLKG